AMNAWERRKAIDWWRANLENPSLAPAPESPPVDFRLMILPREARVQWKTRAEKDFKNLKQSHLRRFAEEYQTGKLPMTPEATALWLALYTPYDFHTACHLE